MLRGCLKERMRKVASEPENPKRNFRTVVSRNSKIAVSSHDLSTLSDRTLIEVA